MKFLPFLLLLLLVSCGASDAKTPVEQRNGNPESIQFFETYTLKDISAEWLEACKYSAETDPLAPRGKVTSDQIGFLGLRNLVRIPGGDLGPVCYVEKSNRFAVDSILSIPEIAKLFPKDLTFMWSLNPQTGDSPALYELFAIKMPKNKQARIDGRHIAESVPETDQNTGSVIINVQMTKEGAVEWESMTRDNTNRFIAMVVNQKVLSCPKVMMAIKGGKTQIAGNFSMEEAGQISDLINGNE